MPTYVPQTLFVSLLIDSVKLLDCCLHRKCSCDEDNIYLNIFISAIRT